uniref:NADH-ubiquinone oxidoreductase chain 6 n=1 Tax=Meira sp. (in: basidiomycete fungi) TaxID=1707708 RepID=A0A7G5VV03_9BASI|nr:NADH dehydrogenase subunit 6 [Meira sp. (in: basidiomycete fungi)]
MNIFLLDFLALGAIVSGILVITSKNPVISVLFLISVFVNVAGYLVLLGVGFIGISYIVVYVGAVTVLFLFVIMMLNLQLAELNAVGTEYTQNLPLGAILGSVFLFELTSVLPPVLGQLFSQVMLGVLTTIHFNLLGKTDYNNVNDVHLAFQSLNIDTAFTSTSGLKIQSIGAMLYTHAAIWLILAGVILLLAMISPILLSMNRK